MERLAGAMVSDVWRDGDRVVRTWPERADFVHGVLDFLVATGFEAAPRFLGRDERGREVLEYVAGASRDSPVPDSVEAVMALVRRFHDLTAGTRWAEGGEVVCHNDLAPRNTIWTDDGRIAAFVDWDLAAPGRRIEDVAHVCWQFIDVADGGSAPIVRRAVDAYGLDAAGRAILLDEIAAWQQRCADGIDERAAAGLGPFVRLVELGAPEQIRTTRAALLANRTAFDRALA